MADDNEVKGTRGFVITTEPTKESKEFIAQYLRDKAVEQANLQAEREADVPDLRRTQRQTLDRADFRGDRADPFNTLGAQGNMPTEMTEGIGNILERERFTYRGPVDKSQGTNDNYITTLYNKYLGREPDAGGAGGPCHRRRGAHGHRCPGRGGAGSAGYRNRLRRAQLPHGVLPGSGKRAGATGGYHRPQPAKLAAR